MDPNEKLSQSELAKSKGTNFFKVRSTDSLIYQQIGVEI